MDSARWRSHALTVAYGAVEVSESDLKSRFRKAPRFEAPDDAMMLRALYHPYGFAELTSEMRRAIEIQETKREHVTHDKKFPKGQLGVRCSVCGRSSINRYSFKMQVCAGKVESCSQYRARMRHFVAARRRVAKSIGKGAPKHLRPQTKRRKMTDGKWPKAKREKEPDLRGQQRALAKGALATCTDQGGYACRGLRKTALESNVLEPDLHAQLRALEDGALAMDTDPGDGLLQGDEVCVRRREPRRPCELGDDPEALR